MKIGQIQSILLFDMDGVLITSEGYYRSLQDVIKLIGQNLGIGNPNLDRDTISKLEASGLTHIWEHLAIFSAMVLLHVWPEIPEARIPIKIDPAPDFFLNIDGIDFSQLIRRLNPNKIYLLAGIKEVLMGYQPELSATQIEYIDLLFGTIKDISHSPILPVMQEFVLGSGQYSQIYNRPSQLNVESYPRQFDRAVLSQDHHKRLVDWLREENHRAAIFTNRPDMPPGDFFGVPEAELGAEIVGLSELPLVGAGSLDWLADRNGKKDCYYKPDPIHALGALQTTLGRPVKESLDLAYEFVTKETSMSEDWQALRDVRLYVFEDSKGGLASVKKACQLLDDRGIGIDLHLIGVSTQDDKIRSLKEITAQVFIDINHSPLPGILAERY